MQKFFIIESELFDLLSNKNIDLYNRKLERYEDHFVNELQETYAELEAPFDDSYYERKKGETKNRPRHLFKISEYEHPKYGKLYLAYTSNTNPVLKPSLSYFQCFYITQVEGEWKILKMSIVNHNRTKKKKYWSSMDGYNDVSFTQSGKFICAERYIEPSACEFSMKDYLTDK
ncbi:hypothetical protein [Aureivirga sp. CE67]|uniref:hypothetical protein n=1 Tax=Aureivirga sp. CE67 TaxID=1788983 RepID=UPI0018C8DB0A|nr:hypothetical protein [Aureivirga sp. CE67]